GRAVLLHLLDAAQTSMLKERVAHRERLVNDQDLRIGGHRGGESETYIHAAGVGFDRLMNELADLSEALNFRQQVFCLSASEAHERRAHEDIFDARKFKIEAGA